MSYLTTRQVAQRLAVDPGKVRAWLRSGQLASIDVSEEPGKKPRYRISEDEVRRFEELRSVRRPEAKRRRRPKMKFLYT